MECANKIKDSLEDMELHEEQISIKFKGDYIWSNTADKVISENGFHIGILYDGKVYDNIDTAGEY